jgi:hypothetical protein
MGLFFTNRWLPQDWVRCAARQTSHWVRIFKLAQRHLRSHLGKEVLRNQGPQSSRHTRKELFLGLAILHRRVANGIYLAPLWLLDFNAGRESQLHEPEAQLRAPKRGSSNFSKTT